MSCPCRCAKTSGGSRTSNHLTTWPGRTNWPTRSMTGRVASAKRRRMAGGGLFPAAWCRRPDLLACSAGFLAGWLAGSPIWSLAEDRRSWACLWRRVDAGRARLCIARRRVALTSPLGLDFDPPAAPSLANLCPGCSECCPRIGQNSPEPQGLDEITFRTAARPSMPSRTSVISCPLRDRTPRFAGLGNYLGLLGCSPRLLPAPPCSSTAS